MDVIIDGKLYKATEQPIIFILGYEDKINIASMANDATRYGCFPSETSQEEMERMLKETMEMA